MPGSAPRLSPLRSPQYPWEFGFSVSHWTASPAGRGAPTLPPPTPRSGCTRPFAPPSPPGNQHEGNRSDCAVSISFQSRRWLCWDSASSAVPASPRLGGWGVGGAGAKGLPLRSAPGGSAFRPIAVSMGRGQSLRGRKYGITSVLGVLAGNTDAEDRPRAREGRGGSADSPLNLNQVGGEGKTSPRGDGEQNAAVSPPGPPAAGGCGDDMGTLGQGNVGTWGHWDGNKEVLLGRCGVFQQDPPGAVAPKQPFSRLNPRDFPLVILKCSFHSLFLFFFFFSFPFFFFFFSSFFFFFFSLHFILFIILSFICYIGSIASSA